MFKHLHNAITGLVTGGGDIRTRLKYAGVHFTCIAIEAVPAHLQPLAQEIRDYLTEYKAKPGASYPYDSDVAVTMKRRRNSTAVKAAEKMWSLYSQYRDALDEKSAYNLSLNTDARKSSARRLALR